MKLVKGLLVATATAAAALAFSAGPASAHVAGDDWDTTNVGLLNGNSFDTSLEIPVNICGNSLAILGIASGSAICINH
ncbi:chaplin family protein [Actinoplanes sp. NPDC051859]|uniref:chaplin family protein n=1 Tax=Actinoplanes sp. NPDC051859 TaxID=3363909 RepID=UPI00379D64E7